MKKDKSKQAVSIYNKIAKSYSDEFNQPSEYIDKFLDLLPKNGKVLDVGCGLGIDANYMNKKGFRVKGVDLSEKMIKLAKQKFPNVNFEITDMRDMKSKPSFFDGIFVAYSLIHIPKEEVLKVLECLNNLLKPKGIIYIAVQSGDSQEKLITEPFKPDEKIFLNIFSQQETKELMRKAEFSIIGEYKRESLKAKEFDFVKYFILAKKEI